MSNPDKVSDFVVDEAWFRKIIPWILAQCSGAMTLTEIAKYICEHFEMPVAASAPNPSRGMEPKWKQILRNIISHSGTYHEFPEGFIIMLVKTGERFRSGKKEGQEKTEYIFMLKEEGQQVARPSTDSMPRNKSVYTIKVRPPKKEVKKTNPMRPLQQASSATIKRATGKRKKTKRHGRKIDWKQQNERCRRVGYKGELFAVMCEMAFILTHCPQKIRCLVWVSRLLGDGYGYDIRSVDHTDYNKPLFIEVKSTENSNGKIPSFNMSRNEKDFLMSAEYDHLNRVLRYQYAPNKDLSSFETRDITPEELRTNFDFNAKSYDVKEAE